MSQSNRDKKLKLVILVGVLGPSLAKVFFPGNEMVENFVDMLALVTTLIWLFEF